MSIIQCREEIVILYVVTQSQRNVRGKGRDGSPGAGACAGCVGIDRVTIITSHDRLLESCLGARDNRPEELVGVFRSRDGVELLAE